MRHPSMVRILDAGTQLQDFYRIMLMRHPLAAEFRGPGVHHNFDDSDSGYDVDMDHKSKAASIGSYRGRIIFLGDGSEVQTASSDTDAEMFNQEDKDLDSQVSKPAAEGESSKSDGKAEASSDAATSSPGQSKKDAKA